MTFISRPPDRSDSLIALALAAGVFVVYALGACRTIYVGDSGELVTAVAVLGIPHPSGYPLYVMLGKLWTLLVPFGSIAFRMSLFSAFFAAGACGLLYRLGREMRLPVPASILSALLLAAPPASTLRSVARDIEDVVERALRIPVEVVVLNRAPADLVHRVLRDGIPVLDRDRAARLRFEVRARNEYFDLAPLRRLYRRMPA